MANSRSISWTVGLLAGAALSLFGALTLGLTAALINAAVAGARLPPAVSVLVLISALRWMAGALLLLSPTCALLAVLLAWIGREPQRAGPPSLRSPSGRGTPAA